MRGNIIRKILVIMIIFAPVISYSGCKKQAKCGCDGDVITTLSGEASKVYFNDTGTIITLLRLNDAYSTYNFCNPGEVFPKVSGHEYGATLQVSGRVYWDCNYLYQSSSASNSYYMTYKVFMIYVTDITDQPYGKK